MSDALDYKRGLMRLWLVATFIWVAMLCVAFSSTVHFGKAIAHWTGHNITAPTWQVVEDHADGSQLVVIDGTKIKMSIGADGKSFKDLNPADQDKTIREIADKLNLDSSEVVAANKMAADTILTFAALALAPPFAFLILGLAAAWILRGFSPGGT